MIDDNACDTEYPEPVDDEYIANNEVAQDGQPTPLLATIHVVRSVQTLVRLFKSECISPEAINSFGKHLDACHDLFRRLFRCLRKSRLIAAQLRQ